MSVFGRQVDERFLIHRLRSTSTGGIAGGVVAMGLFLYHDWVEHVWNWELLAGGLTMVAVKLGLMAWYHFTD